VTGAQDLAAACVPPRNDEDPLVKPPLRRPRLIDLALITLVGLAASSAADAPAAGTAAGAPAGASARRLPTGVTLDPAGRSIALGSMPLGMALSPDSARLAIVLCGHRDQGIQIVDPDKGVVLQTLVQPAAFLGAAFSPDGRSLYVSGGNQDLIYRYAISDGAATLADSIRLDRSGEVGKGRRYPAGIAVARDGRQLYVAENLADSLAVVDLASGRVTQRLETGRYPYDVVIGPDGRVFVSAWGGAWIATFDRAGARLQAGPRIPVGRHPSALALDREGARLYVARAGYDRIEVVDAHANTLVGELSDAAPAGPAEGSTPDALALSADGRHLLVAEADNNAIAVCALERRPR
jgi:YVTN family beta-propeller protein